MAKLKRPLFSLGARGSLANTLSFDNRSGQPRVRKKPMPAYRQTLFQLYQRWLYQDYVAYWHTLTSTQKAEYRASAARRHITPYARFIQVMLTTMPDIAAMWRLDRFELPIVPDSSPNANNGTLFGGHYDPSRIHTGIHFDGIDDYVSVPDHPSLNPTAAITMRLWLLSLGAQHDWTTIVTKGSFVQYKILFDDSGFKLTFTAWINGVQRNTAAVPISHDVWNKLECSFDGTYLRFYLNTDLKSITGPYPGIINPVAVDLEIGRHYHLASGRNFHGYLDHLQILNRTVSQPARILDYQRSYPL